MKADLPSVHSTFWYDPGCQNAADDRISHHCLGDPMRGFVEGVDRSQTSLLPESLENWVREYNPVRVIDAFVDALVEL